MSWNPFRKKDDPSEQAGAGTAAAPDSPPPEDDATDPLMPEGAVEERATLLAEDGELRLERVEVWGPGGVSDCFLRLLVMEQGPRAAIIEQLLLAAPEELSGFRNLLSRDDCALAAALDLPQTNLAALVSSIAVQDAWPRAGELLAGLGRIAGFLHDLYEHHGWCWHEPQLDGIGVIQLDSSQPAGLVQRQLSFTAWDQLGEGTGSADELAAIFLPVFKHLQDMAQASGFSFAVDQLEQLHDVLEELAGDDELSYSTLAERLAALRPRFTFTGVTDPGRKRQHNEDAYLLHSIDQASGTGAQFMLAAVADGMGGHASGEVASSLALDLLRQQLGLALLAPRSKPLDPTRLGEQLTSIIPAIDRALKERAALEPALEGMGTTLAGIAVLRQVSTLSTGGGAELGREQACVFHVGDSRAYLLTAVGLRPLSRDHSLVADMVMSGAITAAEAFDHPRKNIITRCLGGSNANATPEVHAFTPGLAEVVLLCSDGLTDALRDSDIQRVAEETAGALDELTLALVAAANDAGGPDNITVVLIGCGV